MGVDDLAGSLAQNQDVGRQKQGLVDGVGDEEDRLAVFGFLGPQIQNGVLQQCLGDRVQCAEGLVHQHQGSIEREGAGGCEALALATGKVHWQLVEQLFVQVQVGHPLQRKLLALGSRPVLMLLLQGDADVLARRHPGEQAVVLEDHGAVQAGAGHGLAVHQQLFGIGFLQTGDKAQKGRLTAAGLAEQADEVALVHLVVDTAQDELSRVVRIGELQISEFYVEHAFLLLMPLFQGRLRQAHSSLFSSDT